jgi:hypothetical protein
MTVEPMSICHLPVSCEEANAPPEQGNAVLVAASMLPWEVRKRYKEHISSGVRILSHAQYIRQYLQSLEIPWCSWPEHRMTFTLLEPAQILIVRDVLTKEHERDLPGKER